RSRSPSPSFPRCSRFARGARRGTCATARERSMAPEIAGVLLAAGSSTRMGENKLFLDFGGSTLLRRAAQTALDAGLRPLLVVVGHERERVRAELTGFDCTFVINDAHARGMHTSVSEGFSALPHGTAAAVLLLADMPFVTADMVGAIVSRWR